MQWSTLLALAFAVPNVNALLRFPCSQLVVERFDPLRTPDQVAPHLHQIVGGDAFNVTMNPNNDLPNLSSCTTCQFKEDLSNYWTAVLYFRHQNGSFKRVPQMANQFTGNPRGGMTVYYIQPMSGEKVTAFKKGFRMIVGDAMERANLNTRESKSMTFRCFSANFGDNTAAPGGGSDTVTLPNKACAGGIRSNIYFPTCWDGVNLDSPDHKSHVAYSSGGGGLGGQFGEGGRCPATHPVRLPQLFLEIVWDTRQFNSMWPTNGKQPFVFSMGDPDGYGQHADYVFGWEGDSLQRAMDRCTNVGGGACNQLTNNPESAMNACQQRVRIQEQTEGWLSALPGCNPVQAGPNKATQASGCGAPTTWLP